MNTLFVIYFLTATTIFLMSIIALLINVADGKTTSQCIKELYAYLTSPDVKAYFKRLFS